MESGYGVASTSGARRLVAEPPRYHGPSEPVPLQESDAVDGAVFPGHPEARADLFSAFYPLAAASPVLRRLNLEAHVPSWALASGAQSRPYMHGARPEPPQAPPAATARLHTPDPLNCMPTHDRASAGSGSQGG